jgi:hypothetical protein
MTNADFRQRPLLIFGKYKVTSITKDPLRKDLPRPKKRSLKERELENEDENP